MCGRGCTWVKGKLLLGVAVGLLGAFCQKSQAATFFTPTGASGSGGPVNAEAIFSISGNVVTITLENLLQNPKSAGQLLSGISFDISGATGLNSFSALGNITTISSGGSYSTPTSSTLSQWQALNSGTGFNLNVFSGSTPNGLIIGPDSKGNFDPSLGGMYYNANPSIWNNHQPSVLGSATFTLVIPGVSSSSVVNDVVFNFGTQPGEVSVSVPDAGASVALLGLGLGCLGIFWYRFGRAITA